MEEERIECLMVLQIHLSDTPSIDAVIDRFATTAARTSTRTLNGTLFSTIDSFLNIDILNT